MCYLRVNWPQESIIPKLHILEDHVVEFIRRWKVGFGFYGEQGGESIHQEFNRMIDRYSTIKNPVDRVRYTMNQHLLTACPKTQEVKPVVKKRKVEE